MPQNQPNEPRFDECYRVGTQAEIWVKNIREALANGSIEVKRDREALKTGNVFVEYQCKRQGKYKPSGIAVSTALTWVFVLKDDELAVAVSTERLRKLSRLAYRIEKNRREQILGSHPTKGVVVKLTDLLYREI